MYTVTTGPYDDMGAHTMEVLQCQRAERKAKKENTLKHTKNRHITMLTANAISRKWLKEHDEKFNGKHNSIHVALLSFFI